MFSLAGASVRSWRLGTVDLVDSENQEDVEDEGSLCTRSSAAADLAIDLSVDLIILTDGENIARSGDKLSQVQHYRLKRPLGKRKKGSDSPNRRLIRSSGAKKHLKKPFGMSTRGIVFRKPSLVGNIAWLWLESCGWRRVREACVYAILVQSILFSVPLVCQTLNIMLKR